MDLDKTNILVKWEDSGEDDNSENLCNWDSVTSNYTPEHYELVHINFDQRTSTIVSKLLLKFLQCQEA